MINVSVNMFQLNYQKLTCLHNSEWCTNAVSYCKSRPESRIASGSRSSTQLSSPDHWNLSFATALRCSLPFLSRFTVLCCLNSSQTYFENNVLINEKKSHFWAHSAILCRHRCLPFRHSRHNAAVKILFKHYKLQFTTWRGVISLISSAFLFLLHMAKTCPSKEIWGENLNTWLLQETKSSSLMTVNWKDVKILLYFSEHAFKYCIKTQRSPFLFKVHGKRKENQNHFPYLSH